MSDVPGLFVVSTVQGKQKQHRPGLQAEPHHQELENHGRLPTPCCFPLVCLLILPSATILDNTVP